MSAGAIKRKTLNFGFNIINYDFPRWHTYEWQNFDILDAVLTAANITAVRGAWENSVAYAAGERLVDNDDGNIYLCLISHTSPASGTFAAARAANPTYWSLVASVPIYRGLWTVATGYTTQDIVKEGTAYYLCIKRHTSTNFGNDLVNGCWTLILDTAIDLGKSNPPYNLFNNSGFTVNQRGILTGAISTFGDMLVDRWRTYMQAVANGTLRQTLVAASTPDGGIIRMRLSVDAPNVSPAAGDYSLFGQFIEASRCSGYDFGFASARQLVLRFGVKTNAPGLYTISCTNAASNRYWLGSFTITPAEVGIDVVKSVIIPGDNIGAWLYGDNTGIGITVLITLVSGSDFLGAPGWDVSSKRALAGQINFLGNINNYIEFFDFGLFIDYDNAGAVPRWTNQGYTKELADCQRYYYQTSITANTDYAPGVGTTIWNGDTHPVVMRIAPSMFIITPPFTGNITGTLTLQNISTTNYTLGALATAIGQVYWDGSGVVSFVAEF